MADMDRVPEIERARQLDHIGGVGVHLVAGVGLVGTPMPAPVVGDDAEAFVEEEQHLVVPIVTAERPAVMEHDRRRVLGAPVLVEKVGAIGGGDERHGSAPSNSGGNLRRAWRGRLSG
jgi:hypothetical protein